MINKYYWLLMLVKIALLVACGNSPPPPIAPQKPCEGEECFRLQTIRAFSDVGCETVDERYYRYGRYAQVGPKSGVIKPVSLVLEIYYVDNAAEHDPDAPAINGQYYYNSFKNDLNATSSLVDGEGSKFCLFRKIISGGVEKLGKLRVRALCSAGGYGTKTINYPNDCSDFSGKQRVLSHYWPKSYNFYDTSGFLVSNVSFGDETSLVESCVIKCKYSVGGCRYFSDANLNYDEAAAKWLVNEIKAGSREVSSEVIRDKFGLRDYCSRGNLVIDEDKNLSNSGQPDCNIKINPTALEGPSGTFSLNIMFGGNINAKFSEIKNISVFAITNETKPKVVARDENRNEVGFNESLLGFSYGNNSLVLTTENECLSINFNEAD